MVTKLCCCELRKGIIIFGFLSLLYVPVHIVLIKFIFKWSCGEKEECSYSIYWDVGGFILEFLVYICLIIGGFKRSRILLMPFLLIGGLIIFGFTIWIPIYMSIYGPAIVLVILPGLVIQWYLWICVHQYYHYLNPKHLLYPKYAKPVLQTPTDESEDGTSKRWKILCLPRQNQERNVQGSLLSLKAALENEKILNKHANPK